MDWLTKHYPFSGVQTVNILGEMGPLFTMFLVNGIWGIEAGTWALIGTTIFALVATLAVLGRPPVMPFIAGGVSITFGVMTLITGDPKWVQIKVTIFNTLVAGLLWWGLKTDRNFFQFIFGSSFHYTKEGWNKLAANLAWFFLITAVCNEAVRIGFEDTEFWAMNRLFTGVDVWILFKLFIVMPLTGLYLWWQIRLLQRYRLPVENRVPNP
ncbi:MAG: septation protein IspZ [Hyphomicrobiaceae bacterium]